MRTRRRKSLGRTMGTRRIRRTQMTKRTGQLRGGEGDEGGGREKKDKVHK